MKSINFVIVVLLALLILPMGFSYVKFTSSSYHPGELQVDGTKAPGYWDVTATFSENKYSVPYATFSGYLLKLGATINKPVDVEGVSTNCKINLKEMTNKKDSYTSTALFQINSALPERAGNVFYSRGAYSMISPTGNYMTPTYVKGMCNTMFLYFGNNLVFPGTAMIMDVK
ncbi:MAG: hypothetical protein PHH82_01310 [Candidatus ainarchaeum sp.]|nr:hypothetical protein [Candidatus ainarchaeum sp.]